MLAQARQAGKNNKTMEFTTAQFSGPLDLLLEMIEDEKLDITEISLAKIAVQYVDYIDNNPSIDPGEVADFLVIAARLLLIKSKTLLPYLMRAEDEEEIQDFTEQLKIYKDFVTAAKGLEEIYTNGRFMHSRDAARLNDAEHWFFPPPNVSGGALREALAELAERLRPQPALSEETVMKSVSIEERMAGIRAALEKLSQLNFHSLFDAKDSRIDVIVSFIALLEMMKQRSVMAEQSMLFSDITILKV